MVPITILVTLKGSYSRVIVQFIAHNSVNSISQCTRILQVNTHSIYVIHSVSITMVQSQFNMLSHLMDHIHFTYELCNTHIYSIIFKIILTRRVPIVDPITILIAQKFFALKGSYNYVIPQFIVHN